MAEITQVLGFEASQAIATLNSLNGALRQVNTSIRAMNKATTSANGLATMGTNLNKVNTSAKAAGTSMVGFGTKATKATKSATTATNALTVSWGTLARVVGTQVVVRGVAALQQALGDAAERTKEFETATLRAALVSEEGAEGVNDLRDAFNDLTIATGRSIEEITEAGTEALQKDLGSTKETMELLSGAADDLARITGSDLVSSVNSISSVMKAFNLPLSEANNIADTFFTTIDKGDIKIGEIESRLGTVNPLISTLGGSFEDAAGAAAALTLSGLNTQTAMTQLRNVANKLIRPTDAMKEVFKELGVTTGTELIPKFGSLENVLKALSGEVGKDREKFGDLFNTIRGLLGILTLTGDKGKTLSKIMVAMGENTGKAAEGADELKNTLSFLNDVNTQNLLREIDKLGPAMNELRLGATILGTAFLGVMKDMSDSTAAFAQAAQDNFNDVVSVIDNFSRSGTAKIQDSLVDSLTAGAEAAKTNLKTELQGIADAASQAIADSGLAGAEASQFNAAVEAAAAADSRQATLQAQIRQTTQVMQENAQAQQALADQAVSTARVDDPGFFGPTPAETAAARAEAEALGQTLAEISARAQEANATELTQLKQELALEARKVQSQIEQGQIQGKEQDATEGQLSKVNQVIQARQRLIDLERDSAAETQVQEVAKQQVLKATAQSFDQVTTSADGSTESIKAIPDPQVNASAAIQQMRALEAAAKAALAAARAAASAGGGNAYHGGTPVYRAAGGPTRGADTVPTMLSKGEFVTNARSAAKFAPQLQAMNNGQRPAFREQGGGVTVGDVNVNVTGGSGSENPEHVGRTIANSLRRELRRNTSAL